MSYCPEILSPIAVTSCSEIVVSSKQRQAGGTARWTARFAPQLLERGVDLVDTVIEHAENRRLAKAGRRCDRLFEPLDLIILDIHFFSSAAVSKTPRPWLHAKRGHISHTLRRCASLS